MIYQKIWEPSFVHNLDQNVVKINQKIILHQDYTVLYRLKMQFMSFSNHWSPEIDREVLTVRQPVIAVLYDPIKQVVVLNEQFRVGAFMANINPWVLEPSGGVKDFQESDLSAVIREVKEETGCQVLNSQLITKYLPSGGVFSECVSLYCCEVRVNPLDFPQIHGVPEEGEDIKVHVISVPEVFELLEQDIIFPASLIIGLRWLQLNYLDLNQKWRDKA